MIEEVDENLKLHHYNFEKFDSSPHKREDSRF